MAINFELLEGSTYIARGPTNLGLFVFRSAGAARGVAIDSGGDEDAGRRIVRESERLGVQLVAVLNTHSNADHCGGNAFLQRRTGCVIAATELEAAFLKFPQLEPSFLAGGFPQKAIRNKFLMAPPSRATHFLAPPCGFALDEKGSVHIVEAHAQDANALHVISLPGHYFGMVGILTPDRVFFAADAVAGAHILEKYAVYFFYDIAAELETLSALEHLEAEWFIPSHAEPVRDIKPLVALNRDKIFEIAEVILSLVHSAAGASLEDIVAGICAHYDIALNADQHVLVGSTIRSYLSWLCDQGRLEYGFERNRMMFSTPS